MFFSVQILEKVYVQFQSFLEDPQYKDQHELQATMIRTFGKVAPHAEPHFRDEGIVSCGEGFVWNLLPVNYVIHAYLCIC